MDQDEKDKIVNRVKKLLALGMKDPDTAEAKSAMLKAKEIMDKYDLATIDMNDDGSIDDTNILRMDVDMMSGQQNWESVLMISVTNAFNCEYVRTGLRSGFTPRHVLVGSKTDIDFAGFLFKYVRLQVMKMGDNRGYSGANLTTYCLGSMVTVCDAINRTFGKDAVTSHSDAHASDGTRHALMVVKQDAVARKYKEMFPKVRTSNINVRLRGTADAYYDGQADGNKVRLNRQLNVGDPTSRLR